MHRRKPYGGLLVLAGLLALAVLAAGCGREEVPVPEGAAVQEYRGLAAVYEDAGGGGRSEYRVSVYRESSGEFLLAGTAYDDATFGETTLLHGCTGWEDSGVWQVDADLLADYVKWHRGFSPEGFYSWVNARPAPDHDGPVGGP